MAGTKEHRYELSLEWTGNTGRGTADYRAYARDHEISGAGKSGAIACSSDRVFRGDAARYNPEELLVAALSGCHMLSVLHVCAVAGIVVTDYTDEPYGTMRENSDGSGEFTEVVLRPRMTITDAARVADAQAAHEKAHAVCFIARSVNFPVRHEPVIVAQ